jgi:hypothetical protein
LCWWFNASARKSSFWKLYRKMIWNVAVSTSKVKSKAWCDKLMVEILLVGIIIKLSRICF